MVFNNANKHTSSILTIFIENNYNFINEKTISLTYCFLKFY